MTRLTAADLAKLSKKASHNRVAIAKVASAVSFAAALVGASCIANSSRIAIIAQTVA